MSIRSPGIIRKGDVYLVDFKKNEGSEQNGLRPAVIVQNDMGNILSPTTIVCPLTSREKNMNSTHVVLFPEECGILQPSIVLCEQIRVIDKTRIRKKVGSVVSSCKLEAIEKKIMISCGITA